MAERPVNAELEGVRKEAVINPMPGGITGPPVPRGILLRRFGPPGCGSLR
jgi:hypothetical protein